MGRRKGLKLPPAPRATTLAANDNGPTPERLAQAGLVVASHLGTRRLQIVGAAAPIGGDGVVRLVQAPLERLAARGQLAGDGEKNRKLAEAGADLARHWRFAGLAGLAGVSCERVGGGGDPRHMMPTSERMAFHRGKVRAARAALDPGAWGAVEAVVLEEWNLEEAGRKAGFLHAHAASAVALDRLRRGLELLARLFGHLPPAPPAPANDARPPLAEAG